MERKAAYWVLAMPFRQIGRRALLLRCSGSVYSPKLICRSTMKKLVIKHRRLFSRYLLVLAAAVGITIIIPKDVRFPYDFEVGKPWRYDNLLAPFDFAIEKSEAERSLDMERVLADFLPYYEKKPEVAATAQRNFAADLRLRWPMIAGEGGTPAERDLNGNPSAAVPNGGPDSTQLLQAGLQALEALYKQGILALDTTHRSYPVDHGLLELNGKVARKRRVGDFLSMQQAQNQILLPTTLSAEETAFVRELLLPVLRPDVTYRRHTSEQAMQAELDQVSSHRGKVGEGEKIIFTGEIVTDEKAQILASLRDESDRYTEGYEPYALWVGYFAIVAISLALYSMFLLQYKADVFRHWRSLLFMLLLVLAFISLTVFSEAREYPTLFLVPYCIVPIIIRTFFGTRTALFTHLVVLLIAGFLVSNSGEFMFLHLLAGLAAIFSNLRAQYWSQFFMAMAWLWLTYCLSWLAIGLVQQGSFYHLDTEPFGWLSLNVFFCLMAYPLILVFERLFGVVSDITLRELSDLNKPLLRELSFKAPGTMQHSVQVANLAEAAIAEIGGSALLTKVGALYHDIGKIKNPIFFIENQASGDSPHDALEPEESARMIISHVQNGVDLARKHRLPDSVIDFIKTHHGTTRVEFFWSRYTKLRGQEPAANDDRFRYAGPLPFSKETAVVMLADSLEAASRVLKQPSSKDIDALVERIVHLKIEDEQLVQSELTFRELHQIRKVFRKMLLSIHHVRIAYPEASTP
ncbi:MAG: HDIG domain-containing protein [Bacteroidetes bacterium]|nr:HDIG domain-containing protein [Bacteroidota bacterium]